MIISLAPLPEVPGSPFPDWAETLPENQRAPILAAAPTLSPLFAAAPYLFDIAQKQAAWLAEALERSPDESFEAICAEAAHAGQNGVEEADIMRVLRKGKARTALLAGFAETGGLWTAARTTEALARLADAALEASLDFLMRRAAHKGALTVPADKASAANSGLAIFALGKHGGCELNYSSDIDIVAFYDPDTGVLADPLEANRFYTRIVRRLVALMEDRTEHGYVFRTDLRLRPDPGSTPVAIPVEAALTYYEARGQNWERAAWIKARPCAGDIGVGEAFLRDLRPFVWRKHLDFATIADIQAMKRQINITRKVGEVRVEGHNVKLGRGGIREIEFFAQTQQLIAGGRDPALRVRSTAEALAALSKGNWITEDTAGKLTQIYWFLRAVENRLQMIRDEQTHVMPETEEGVAIIARLMGEGDVDEFKTRYRSALNRVVDFYGELFTQGETLASEMGDLVFTGGDDDPGTLQTLSTLGFADPVKASSTIRKWHYGGYAATRIAAARAHLTELLPALLTTIAATGNADQALQRFDHFLGRLPAGVQLFALLRNHRELRRLLVAFMASAPRMAEAVIHRAHVMDGLIDPAFADDVWRPEVLIEKVNSFLADARTYEELIDRARIIGQEQKFLLSAGFLSGNMTAEQAGAQYTALAETLLGRLFDDVRREFAVRHGIVPGTSIALLGFGKMASREMTVTSDLDFILLYDAPEDAEESDGARPLSASHYFARLTQRLVAALSAPTAEGVLYEADMRLRPSGNAGPLATSLSSFRTYQLSDAWTWEHLALSRARAVYADQGMAAKVDAVITEALNKPRDRDKAVDDIISMRDRMARERKPRHSFDLKLATGGLIDLEFIAQSARLLGPDAVRDRFCTTRETLLRLGEERLVVGDGRLAQTHEIYATILQAMSICLVNPFREEDWTNAFRELLAQRTNYPDFSRLEADLPDMFAFVSAASAEWYSALRRG